MGTYELIREKIHREELEDYWHRQGERYFHLPGKRPADGGSAQPQRSVPGAHDGFAPGLCGNYLLKPWDARLFRRPGSGSLRRRSHGFSVPLR